VEIIHNQFSCCPHLPNNEYDGISLTCGAFYMLDGILILRPFVRIHWAYVGNQIWENLFSPDIDPCWCAEFSIVVRHLTAYGVSHLR
jgi:hypothetical protein